MTEPTSRRPAGNTDLIVHIRPNRGWAFLKLGELWRYRELLYFFVWRDLKVRYRQTLLGAAWAILQPFLALQDRVFRRPDRPQPSRPLRNRGRQPRRLP